MYGMIINIEQEMLICKFVFEIVALFLKLSSLDQLPCHLWNPEWIHFSGQASSAVPLHQRIILDGWPANQRGICTAELVAWYSSQALE